MAEETPLIQPSAAQQVSSDPSPPITSEQYLSPEDKMVLYTVLQEIANELRRIKRERKKLHQTESK